MPNNVVFYGERKNIVQKFDTLADLEMVSCHQFYVLVGCFDVYVTRRSQTIDLSSLKLFRNTFSCKKTMLFVKRKMLKKNVKNGVAQVSHSSSDIYLSIYLLCIFI